MAKNSENKAPCFHCGKSIEGHSYIIGVDVPYINLRFHKECFKKVRGGDEEAYLQKHIKEIYKYKENMENR